MQRHESCSCTVQFNNIHTMLQNLVRYFGKYRRFNLRLRRLRSCCSESEIRVIKAIVGEAEATGARPQSSKTATFHCRFQYGGLDLNLCVCVWWWWAYIYISRVNWFLRLTPNSGPESYVPITNTQYFPRGKQSAQRQPSAHQQNNFENHHTAGKLFSQWRRTQRSHRVHPFGQQNNC